MSIIDTAEEIVSEVDLQAEFTKHGLSFSVYMDDVELKEEVDYDDMAYMMCHDADKYPDPELSRIADGLRMMATILEEELDARG
jgi:hypothetical protein